MDRLYSLSGDVEVYRWYEQTLELIPFEFLKQKRRLMPLLSFAKFKAIDNNQLV